MSTFYKVPCGAVYGISRENLKVSWPSCSNGLESSVPEPPPPVRAVLRPLCSLSVEDADLKPPFPLGQEDGALTGPAEKRSHSLPPLIRPSGVGLSTPAAGSVTGWGGRATRTRALVHGVYTFLFRFFGPILLPLNSIYVFQTLIISLAAYIIISFFK